MAERRRISHAKTPSAPRMSPATNETQCPLQNLPPSINDNIRLTPTNSGSSSHQVISSARTKKRSKKKDSKKENHTTTQDERR